jgi:hypothetical protein|tara:strand:- start:34476 stop:34619 length:144 start_codon:yes stop_codon:yes gene_type:complete
LVQKSLGSSPSRPTKEKILKMGVGGIVIATVFVCLLIGLIIEIKERL